MTIPREPLPEWVLFHVPHDSVEIPDECRELFVLDDDELERESIRMTDLHTFELFAGGVAPGQVVRFPVSRLLVDPERFPDDRDEPMAAKGQGAVYLAASDGRRLKRPLSAIERRYLMERWYFPHHERLLAAVHAALVRYGRALVADCHSFSSVPLPLEPSRDPCRPQVCVGTDPFHTPLEVADAVRGSFAEDGYSVRMNDPFSGTLAPLLHWHHDRRVASVMIEVRRDLYEDEAAGEKHAGFRSVRASVRRAVAAAADAFASL